MFLCQEDKTPALVLFWDEALLCLLSRPLRCELGYWYACAKVSGPKGARMEVAVESISKGLTVEAAGIALASQRLRATSPTPHSLFLCCKASRHVLQSFWKSSWEHIYSSPDLATCWIFTLMKEHSRQIPQQPTVDKGIPEWNRGALFRDKHKSSDQFF